MGNKAKELGVLAVKNITRRGTTFVGGVPGLALVVHKSGTRSWILRYKIGGVRRDMHGMQPVPLGPRLWLAAIPYNSVRPPVALWSRRWLRR